MKIVYIIFSMFMWLQAESTKEIDIDKVKCCALIHPLIKEYGCGCKMEYEQANCDHIGSIPGISDEPYYAIPFQENPQNPKYPCPPKMLEYYDKQKEAEYKRKKQKCDKFIADWNADKYPCIFDSENVDKCREMLYHLYCYGF